MVTIEVYLAGTEDLVATLAYSEKSKKCTIDALDASIKDELGQFVDTVLYLPKRGRAYPENRQVWMEALPIAQVSVPYWFKLADAADKIIEEVENDDKEDTEEGRREEDGESNGESSDNGDGELPNTDGGSSS